MSGLAEDVDPERTLVVRPGDREALAAALAEALRCGETAPARAAHAAEPRPDEAGRLRSWTPTVEAIEDLVRRTTRGRFASSVFDATA